MTVSALMIQPLVALIAGILILRMPRPSNYVVAIYLILVAAPSALAGHPEDGGSPRPTRAI